MEQRLLFVAVAVFGVTTRSAWAASANNQGVLGFEDRTDWTAQGATLSSSTSGTSGNALRVVAPAGWHEITSVTPLTSLGSVGATVAFDLFPESAVSWGEARVIVILPSQGEYWRDLGSVSLSSLSPGTFHRLTFSIPSDLATKLGTSYTDLKLKVVLNTPPAAYRLDGLAFAPGAGGGTPDPGDPDPAPPDPFTLTVTTPPGLGMNQFVVVADGLLDLRDQSEVTAPIANLGSNGTFVGNDAIATDIHSLSSVTLRDRSTVSGLIRTGGTVTELNAVNYEGPPVEGASFEPATEQELSATFPGTTLGDILLEPDQLADKTPGRYGTVRVKSRAELTLHSGTYYFDTFEVLEPQARLVLDESNGPVVLNVLQPFAFRGEVISNLSHTELLVAVFGTGTIHIEAPFRGTIVAPLADLKLGTVSGVHSGAFYAKNVEIQPGARILFHPSVALEGDPGGPGPFEGDRRFAITRIGEPIPDYESGHDGCVGTLEYEAEISGGEVVSASIVPRDPPDPGCQIETLFCSTANPSVPLNPQPTLAQLNAPVNESSVCPAVVPGPSSLCMLDPETVVDPCLVPEPLRDLCPDRCETDADCTGGTLCGIYCWDATCDDSYRACGELLPFCGGLPNAEACEEFTECDDPASSGELQSLTDQLETSNEPGPGMTIPADELIPPPGPTFPPPWLLPGAVCDYGATRQPVAPVEQGAPNDILLGTDTWGVFLENEVSQRGSANAMFPTGLPNFDFGGSASFAVGANVWGHRVEVLSASAEAILSSCRRALTGVATVFGDDVARAGLGSDTDPNQTAACEEMISDYEDAVRSLSLAYSQAAAIQSHITMHGPRFPLCDETNQEFGTWYPDVFTALPCIDNPDGSAIAVVEWWRWHAGNRLAEFEVARTNLLTQIGVITGAGGATSPIGVDDQYSIVGSEAQIPIGPIVITLSAELFGEWFVNGSATYSVNLATPAAGVGALLTPGVRTFAYAYAGVGIPGVSLGVEGEVTLIGISFPVEASIGISREATEDRRLDNVAGTPWEGAAWAFPGGPQEHDWGYNWSFGASADFDFLSGKLNAAARVGFGFFSKTFRKNIVSWDGVSRRIKLVGVAGDLPGDGSSDPNSTPPVEPLVDASPGGIGSSNFMYYDLGGFDGTLPTPPEPDPSRPYAGPQLQLEVDWDSNTCSGGPR
jgi:hypothetical protein